MTQHDVPGLLAFADTLADAARAAILPYFRADHAINHKGGDRFDPVTDADQAAERDMRALISRHRPDDAVLGEEFGETHGASGYRWILDPIDGTRAFISGLPTWGVLIGLYHDGRPLIGIIDQPYLQERYRGWGDGADVVVRGERRQLQVRRCADMSAAILSSTDPYLFAGAETEAFTRVRKAAKLTRYGYDCYAYAMLAAGYIDCVIESGLKTFDVAALIPVVTGAGGGMCDWSGGNASQGGQVLAFGDTRIRDQVLPMLAT